MDGCRAMKHFPASRTCGSARGATCRRCSSITPTPAPTTRRRCAPTAPTWRSIKLRQRVLRDVDQRSTATTILGEQVPVPLALGPIGLGGMMHGDGEIMACRAAQAAGIPVHAVHHVDQFDRGRGRRGRQAVLVPALRDARPRLHPRADPARGRGEMQRADADGRSSGARPAPRRRAQRLDRAAGDQAQERHRHRDQARLGALHPQGQAQDLRQSLRPREGHGEHQLAGGLDREPVRSDPELEGRRMGQEPVARQAHPQGHPRRR